MREGPLFPCMKRLERAVDTMPTTMTTFTAMTMAAGMLRLVKISAKILSDLPPKRKLSSGVKNYLHEQGYDDQVTEGILNAFLPNKPSVAEIKALGQQGLLSLSESVKRELQANKNSSKRIQIHVKIPHQKTEFSITAPVGQTFYQLARQNPDLGQYLECACSGVAACSTCHIILQEDQFSRLPAPQEDELDMLDLAAGVAPTSRLGCQIKFTEDIDGLVVTIPPSVNNLFS